MEKSSFSQVKNQAIQLARNGHRASAAHLLAQIVLQNPQDEQAWLWLAACLDDPEKQRYCLNRAVQINPSNHRARQALEHLSRTTQSTQPVNRPTSPAVQSTRVPVTGIGSGAMVFPVPPELNQGVSDISSGAINSSPPAEITRPASVRRGNAPRIGLLIIGIILVLAAILYYVWVFVLQKPPPINIGSLALFTSNNVHISTSEPDLAEQIHQALPGATIELQAGDYQVNETIVIDKPIQIIGAGVDKTHLIINAAGAGIHVKSIGPFSLKGIDIRYAGELAADGVVVDGGVVDFSDCRIGGFLWNEQQGGGRGLVLKGPTTGEILKCEIVDNAAIGVFFGGQSDLQLIDNLVHRNGYGIAAGENAKPVISNNIIAENNHIGLVYYQNGGGKAAQNQITDNLESGVEINDQAAPVFTQNITLRNQEFGIKINGRAQPMLLTNTSRQNSKAGIAYFGNSRGAAQDNICSENEMHGISVNEQASPFLKENHCQRNKQVGIDYWGSAGGTAANNDCSENGLQGISLHENASPTLENNICNRNSDSGIIYWGNSSGSARNNECSQNILNGISIHDQARPVLSLNTCQGNGKAGISYYDRAKGEANQNACTANGKAELEIMDQAAPALQNNQCNRQ